MVKFVNKTLNPRWAHTDYDYGKYLNQFVFRMDEAQSILVLGCTPPAVRYFGVNPYMFSRNENEIEGGWVNVFGSLGDSLNPDRIIVQDDGTNGVFNKHFSAIFVNEAQTAQNLNALLKNDKVLNQIL
eukprot:UN34821